MVRDLLFVTIDCWRYDAPEHMPGLKYLTGDWQRGDVMCAGAATNGVFPALLASQYAPATYETDGSLKDSVKSFPDVLREAGYETGGFVASNPFLGKWSHGFDTFWNDGMTAEGVDRNREEYGSLDKVWSLLRLQPRVSAEEVLSRATEWWKHTSSPRFCWVHLMEPHGPYYSGLKRGISDGLLRSYLSIVGYSAMREDVPDWMRRHLRRLHFSCVEQLDSVLAPWLSSFDDPLIVITGDHGEEFDHGAYGHSRLYDETVRVPMYATDDAIITDGEISRQLDMPARICQALGVDRPERWQGTTEIDDPAQCMLSQAGGLSRIYAGVRTTSEKLIRTYNWEGEKLGEEAYDLDADPEERDPISNQSDRLTTRLDEFLGREDVQETIGTGKRTGIDDAVEERLEDLGYVEPK